MCDLVRKEGDLGGFAFTGFGFYAEFLEPNAARDIGALQHQYGWFASLPGALAWSEFESLRRHFDARRRDWECAA
jgi:hypothetical protein